MKTQIKRTYHIFKQIGLFLSYIIISLLAKTKEKDTEKTRNIEEKHMKRWYTMNTKISLFKRINIRVLRKAVTLFTVLAFFTSNVCWGWFYYRDEDEISAIGEGRIDGARGVDDKDSDGASGWGAPDTKQQEFQPGLAQLKKALVMDCMCKLASIEDPEQLTAALEELGLNLDSEQKATLAKLNVISEPADSQKMQEVLKDPAMKRAVRDFIWNLLKNDSDEWRHKKMTALGFKAAEDEKEVFVQVKSPQEKPADEDAGAVTEDEELASIKDIPGQVVDQIAPGTEGRPEEAEGVLEEAVEEAVSEVRQEQAGISEKEDIEQIKVDEEAETSQQEAEQLAAAVEEFKEDADNFSEQHQERRQQYAQSYDEKSKGIDDTEAADGDKSIRQSYKEISDGLKQEYTELKKELAQDYSELTREYKEISSELKYAYAKADKEFKQNYASQIDSAQREFVVLRQQYQQLKTELKGEYAAQRKQLNLAKKSRKWQTRITKKETWSRLVWATRLLSI
jgi:hypothetical protein